MCHLGKETTESISVTWIQRQKAAQCQWRSIIVLDEIQDLLQLQDSFVIAACACVNTLQIVMITKNQIQKSGKIVQAQTAHNQKVSSIMRQKDCLQLHKCPHISE